MADKKPTPRVQALAAQAWRAPETLSYEEIRTLGASLVAQSDGTPGPVEARVRKRR